MIRLPPEVIGRAMSDAAFRKQLFDDPRAALDAAGLSADDATVDAIKKLDQGAVEEFIHGLGNAVGDNAAG
jgi:hypothetical protein